MQDNNNKQTIPTNKIKRKQFGYISPFQCYNNNPNQQQTKQRNTSYMMASSYRKSNRSMLEYDDVQIMRGQLCLKHSLVLNWVCFTCGFDVYCSQCMMQSHKGGNKVGSKQDTLLQRSQVPKQTILSTTKQPSTISFSTQNHDIRPIQKSYMYMRNSLIQCQIKLQAKCNILTNMNQQVHNQKIQLYNQKNEYRQQLQRQFEYIYQILRQKQQQMCVQIQEIFIQNQKKYISTIDEIKSLQEYYDQCQHAIAGVLEQQRQSGSNNMNKNINSTNLNTQRDMQLHTCLFYSQHSSTLTQLLSDQEILNIKNQIYSINYKLENHNLNDILNYINSLDLGYEQKFVYKNTQQKPRQQQSESNSLQKQLHKVKSQTLITNKINAQQKKSTKKNINYPHLQQVTKIPSSTKYIHPLLNNRTQKQQRQSHKVLPTFGTSTPKALSKENKIDFLKKSPQNMLLKKRKKSNAKMVSMPASPAKQDKDQRTFSPINKARDFIIEGMKKKTTIVKKKK